MSDARGLILLAKVLLRSYKYAPLSGSRLEMILHVEKYKSIVNLIKEKYGD